MEKLIELVVKCQKELKQGYPLWDTEWAIKNSKEILISKSFWFIKWLVDNDKIYISKSWIDDLPAMFAYDYESVECKSDRLVMMLSIQDNPIEYLVNILK